MLATPLLQLLIPTASSGRAEAGAEPVTGLRRPARGGIRVKKVLLIFLHVIEPLPKGEGRIEQKCMGKYMN